MIDFKKLSDPAYQAEQRAAREAEDKAREALDALQREQIDRCLDNYDSLPQKEREFVLSCRMRTGRWLPLTEKQSKWLSDIAARFAETKGGAA